MNFWFKITSIQNFYSAAVPSIFFYCWFLFSGTSLIWCWTNYGSQFSTFFNQYENLFRSFFALKTLPNCIIHKSLNLIWKWHKHTFPWPSINYNFFQKAYERISIYFFLNINSINTILIGHLYHLKITL